MTEPMPLDTASMSYRDLQRECVSVGLPGKAKKEELRQNLEDYLKDPEATLERLGKKVISKDNWVDWKNHAAREILLEDLERGGWLYELQDNEDPRAIFDIYQDRQEEFKDIPFDQFKERYLDSTKAAIKRRARSSKEEEFFRHDRLLHPRQSHNDRGEPVFNMDTEAKKQLRDDITNKQHKTMEPMELWLSRKVYRKYKLHIFRPRIYQEIRRNKYINWLEMKRTEQRDAHAKKKASERKAAEKAREKAAKNAAKNAANVAVNK